MKNKCHLEIRSFTDEETTFIIAIDRWKTKHQRQPTVREILAIARALGYRKVDGTSTPRTD